jgi:hypothetical protein
MLDITMQMKRHFQNRRSLLPVPLALALSLTFVYLAAGNFDPSDFAIDGTDVQNEQCAANLEKKSLLGSEVASEDVMIHPCVDSRGNPDTAESVESWADLWPRLKTRAPRS